MATEVAVSQCCYAVRARCAALVGRRGTCPTAAAAANLFLCCRFLSFFLPQELDSAGPALTPVEVKDWDSPISGERSGGICQIERLLDYEPSLPLLLTEDKEKEENSRFDVSTFFAHTLTARGALPFLSSTVWREELRLASESDSGRCPARGASNFHAEARSGSVASRSLSPLRLDRLNQPIRDPSEPDYTGLPRVLCDWHQTAAGLVDNLIRSPLQTPKK